MKKIECPNCKKKIDEDSLKKEFHPNGRQAKCPKCKKKIIFYRQSRNLVEDKDHPGTLKRRFKNA